MVTDDSKFWDSNKKEKEHQEDTVKDYAGHVTDAATITRNYANIDNYDPDRYLYKHKFYVSDMDQEYDEWLNGMRYKYIGKNMPVDWLGWI